MAVWPRPEAVTPGQETLCLSRHVSWQPVGFSSDILEAGFDRYTAILQAMPLGLGLEVQGTAAAAGGPALTATAALNGTTSTVGRPRRHCQVIHSVEVSVTSSDQSLNLETRESYSLEVAAPATMIQANSVYGALRAMETLAQLARRRAVAPAAAANQVGSDGDGSSGSSGSSRDGEEVLWREDELAPEAVWPVEGEEEGGDVSAEVARRKRRHKTVLLIEATDIYDAPRFRYRGLLLDTARHYLPIHVIKAHLDAMTMVKMNCLHWHLTDDESFPWASEELPELSGRGAFAPEAVYTAADIKEVVEFARFRGIRVIPELDSPGHTQSWGKGYPALLTDCYDTANGEKTGELGPVNPARNETYGFLWRLIREISRHFPDPYLHLGGDEVDHACWKSNPEVQAFMAAKGFGSDYSKLEGYYMEQLVHLAATAGKGAIVWQDAFDQGDSLPALTRVQVWKWWKDEGAEGSGAEGLGSGPLQQQAQADGSGNNVAGSGRGRGSSSSSSKGSVGAERSFGTEGGTAGTAGTAIAAAAAEGGSRMDQRRRLAAAQAAQQGLHGGCGSGQGCQADAGDDAWKEELQRITKAGYDVILSAPWYLNLGCYASQDWRQYYAADPHDWAGSTEQKDHVLGGEACAWGEFIDAVNSINRVWPRAAAVAERLWSPPDATNADEAAARLADVRCRMLSRGIAAQSMGPGFCPGELTTRM